MRRMEHAGKAVFAALRRVADQEKPLDLLAAVWPLVVGVRLAEQTRPVAWEKGWLQVAVSDLHWQEQLERMPHTLRDQINKWWGASVVQEVSFVRGKVAPQGSEARPSAARTKASKASGAKPEKVEEIEGALARIKDPTLRRVVARLAAQYLSKREK